MNPLNIFGSLSASLGISDILNEKPLDRAMRLAQEVELRRQEQDKSREQAVKSDSNRKSQLESRLKALQLKHSQTTPKNQKDALLATIRVVESQLAAQAYVSQARPAAPGQPPAQDVRSAPQAPTAPPAAADEVADLQAQLDQVTQQISDAQGRNEGREKLFPLELKQDFIRTALETARQNPAAALSQPFLTDGMTAGEVRSELAQLDWALEELGTGYELATDPEKLSLAQELRQERDRLLFQLARAEVNSGGKAAGDATAAQLAGGQDVAGAGDVWASKDPKVQAFLTKYYGETSQFPDVKKLDPEVIAKNATHQKAAELADTVAVELGLVPPEGEAPRSNDTRQELGTLRAAAYNQLHQNAARPDMADAAKSGLMQQLLTSDQGIQLLRKDVSELVKGGKQAGAFKQPESEQLDRVLRNTFDPDLKEKVKQIFIRNPKADLKQVAKEVFLDASRTAQQRAGGRGARADVGTAQPGGAQSLRMALSGGGLIRS